MSIVFGSPEAAAIIKADKMRYAAPQLNDDGAPCGELTAGERFDAEEIALIIIGNSDTDVTPEQVSEWPDGDLIEWLVLWGNEWAAKIQAKRFC